MQVPGETGGWKRVGQGAIGVVEEGSRSLGEFGPSTCPYIMGLLPMYCFRAGGRGCFMAVKNHTSWSA